MTICKGKGDSTTPQKQEHQAWFSKAHSDDLLISIMDVGNNFYEWNEWDLWFVVEGLGVLLMSLTTWCGWPWCPQNSGLWWLGLLAATVTHMSPIQGTLPLELRTESGCFPSLVQISLRSLFIIYKTKTFLLLTLTRDLLPMKQRAKGQETDK